MPSEQSVEAAAGETHTAAADNPQVADSPLVADPRGPYGDATSVTAGPDGSIWVLYRCAFPGGVPSHPCLPSHCSSDVEGSAGGEFDS